MTIVRSRHCIIAVKRLTSVNIRSCTSMHGHTFVRIRCCPKDPLRQTCARTYLRLLFMYRIIASPRDYEITTVKLIVCVNELQSQWFQPLFYYYGVKPTHGYCDTISFGTSHDSDRRGGHERKHTHASFI